MKLDFVEKFLPTLGTLLGLFICMNFVPVILMTGFERTLSTVYTHGGILP
uniref:Uncharacterized protein n=1 Tax=Anguilla anguilla TaxID=7936 RepID=A0A0E9Q3Z3_ANGAN